MESKLYKHSKEEFVDKAKVLTGVISEIMRCGKMDGYLILDPYTRHCLEEVKGNHFSFHRWGHTISVPLGKDNGLTKLGIDVSVLLDKSCTAYVKECVALKLPLTFTSAFIINVVIALSDLKEKVDIVREGMADTYENIFYTIKNITAPDTAYYLDIERLNTENYLMKHLPNIMSDLKSLNPEYLTYLD